MIIFFKIDIDFTTMRNIEGQLLITTTFAAILPRVYHSILYLQNDKNTA